MEINLGNKIYNIRLQITSRPNLKKLKKELSDFFENNKIEGIEIRKFGLGYDALSHHKIFPEEPYFEGCLNGGEYKDKLRKIGEKYDINNLNFIHWCYYK